MWDFEHPPEQERLQQRYEIRYTTPAQCAAQLASGQSDIGLVPVAAYATIPSLLIVPGCTIASLHQVRSILLVVRSSGGVSAVRRVALDTSSLTSNAYLRILFARFWKIGVEFVSHAPDLDGMLETADAAMLIGDPALLALEGRESRESRGGEELQYLDLAECWRDFTGLPWISAVWALRDGALARTGIATRAVVEDLQASRDHGLARVDELVAEWSGRIAVPAATIRTYLTRNIHFTLDEECLQGLRAFYRYAAECGVLPGIPDLHFL